MSSDADLTKTIILSTILHFQFPYPSASLPLTHNIQKSRYLKTIFTNIRAVFKFSLPGSAQSPLSHTCQALLRFLFSFLLLPSICLVHHLSLLLLSLEPDDHQVCLPPQCFSIVQMSMFHSTGLSRYDIRSYLAQYVLLFTNKLLENSL